VAQLWLPDKKPGAATPGLLHDVLRKHDPGHVLLRALDHTVASAGSAGRAWSSATNPGTSRPSFASA